MQRYGGADGTKSDGGIAYRFQITFGIKALIIKLLKSLQTSSVALCTDGASVTFIAFSYNPPSSPFLRVIFRQKPNLKWQNLLLQNPEDPFFLCKTSLRILINKTNKLFIAIQQIFPQKLKLKLVYQYIFLFLQVIPRFVYRGM